MCFLHRGRRPWGRAISSSAGVSAGALLFLLVIPGSIIGWQKNLHYLDVWQKQVVMNERVGPTSNFNIHSYRNQSLANGVFLMSEAIRPAAAAAAVSNARPVRDRPGRIGHPIARVGIGVVLMALLAVVAIVGRRENNSRRIRGVRAGLLRDALGFAAGVGALLHGGAAGALMRADVAFQAWDAAGGAGCCGDSCCPLVGVLLGDALCGWGWDFGAGDGGVVCDGVRVGALGGAIGAVHGVGAAVDSA